MAKKLSARALRRHPGILNEIFSSAGPSQINGQYKAAREDLPELLAAARDEEQGTP